MLYRRFMVRSGPAKVYFGIGSIEELDPWVRSYRRVFIVTGRHSARVSGALDDVVGILSKHGIEYGIYDKVLSNPTTDMVDEAASMIQGGGAEAVIVIGGGSVIDTAKIASVIARCGGYAREYLKGIRKPYASIPLVAINLTHGTGTEADRYAVITIMETNEKIGVASEYFYPSISIDDPRYLKTLPRNQTIYTALDAFYHALESATSKTGSPYTEMLGEKTVELIAKWLPLAIKNPGDIEARYWLLYASMIAGISIDHGRTHLIHAMEHALSGINPRLAHGAGLAILGPHIVKLVYKTKPETTYKLLRHIDPALKPKPEYAIQAAKTVKEFQEKIGFKEKLENYGFTTQHIEKIKQITLESLKHLAELAPFKITPELIEDIYKNTLEDKDPA